MYWTKLEPVTFALEVGALTPDYLGWNDMRRISGDTVRHKISMKDFLRIFWIWSLSASYFALRQGFFILTKF